MNYIIFFGFFFFLSLGAYRRTDLSESQKERALLFKRFHGKYKILSATAEQPLDLNFDGLGSTHLKGELANLSNCNLEIRLPKEEQTNFFIEFWPEQFFSGTTPATFDPSISVHYPNQSVVRTFRFSVDKKAIRLNEDPAGIDQQRHTWPESVTILPGDRIELVKRKWFYTTAGWREVRVVTLYERYTMET